MHAARLISLASLFAALSACGGGGDSGGTPPPPPPPPPPIGTAGIFDVDYGQFTGVYTMLDDGRFYGMHFVSGGSVLAGHPHGPLSANNSTGSREHIAWANFIDDLHQTGRQEQAGVFGRTFHPSTLDVSITGSMGSFSATATRQKTWGSDDTHTLYNDPIPLASLAGNYSGIVRTVGIATPQQSVTGFALGADGHWSITAAGCHFEGTLAQYRSTGVYEAEATTSGDGCHFTGPLAGVLMPTSYANGVPRLGLQLDTADNAQTAVFLLNKQ